MKKPTLSIIIPTLNEEKYILKCLTSLKNQTFQDFEIIISDGGSKDNTVKIARKFTDNIIEVKGTNVCQARNLALIRAKADIIVSADADTFYPKSHLEIIYNTFRNNQVIAVTGKTRVKNAPLWSIIYWKVIYKWLEIVYSVFGKVLYTPALNLAFRKKSFLEQGGYNINLDFGGDEIDVLNKLKKVKLEDGKNAKLVFNSLLQPITSGRRFSEGFFTFFIKHAFYYYWLNYLSAKLLGKAIIKAKPVR